MMTATYAVTGMTCEGCVRSVTRAIQRAGGLDVVVDLASGRVTVGGEIDEAKVSSAVEAAGFAFAGRATAA